MTVRELAVMEALNIASTIHRKDRMYQATAAQIAGLLLTDPRFDDYGESVRAMSVRQVGAVLRGLAKRPWPGSVHSPLVERVGTKKWCLTETACMVMNA